MFISLQLPPKLGCNAIPTQFELYAHCPACYHQILTSNPQVVVKVLSSWTEDNVMPGKALISLHCINPNSTVSN